MRLEFKGCTALRVLLLALPESVFDRVPMKSGYRHAIVLFSCKVTLYLFCTDYATNVSHCLLLAGHQGCTMSTPVVQAPPFSTPNAYILIEIVIGHAANAPTCCGYIYVLHYI